MSRDSHAIKTLVELILQVAARWRVSIFARFDYPPAMHKECAGILVEALEPRLLLSAAPVVEHAIGDVELASGQQIAVDLFETFDDDETVFKFDSNMGDVDVLMYEDDCPATVENFRKYSQAGAYEYTIIHRSVTNFVLQGGGYNYNYVGNGLNIEQLADLFDPVVNEYLHSNTAGTIAMAKLGGDPDSATSQWFFNLGDNSANLENQNGGFTVFGEVLDTGMADVIYPMAGVPVYNAGAPLDILPLRNYDDSLTQLTDNNYLVFYDIFETSMSFAITGNTNPNLVTTNVDPVTRALSATAVQGVLGQADITITATDREGKTVSDTFTISVTTMEIQAGRSGQYTEPDGDVVTVDYKGKSGGVLDVGVSFASGNIDFITGQGAGIGDSVDIKIKKSAGGDGRVILNSVNVNGSFKSFKGMTVDLVGDITFTGVIVTLQLGHVDASVITYNTALADPDVLAAKGVAVKFETVEDCILDTNNVGLSKLDAMEWLGGSLSARWLSSLSVKSKNGASGNFNADVTLTGADAEGVSLNKAQVSGQNTSGIWTLAGHLNSLKALATGTAWQLVAQGFVKTLSTTQGLAGTISGLWFGKVTTKGTLSADITASGAATKGVSIGTLQAGTVGNVSLDVAGGIQTIKVISWLAGNIRALWIASLKTTGDFGADLTLLGSDAKGCSLKTATVGGAISSDSWDIVGAVNAIKTLSTQAGWQFAALGFVKTLDASQGLAGVMSALWFGKVTTKGDLSVGLVAQEADGKGLALSSLTVSGRIINSSILALNGSINTLTAGAMQDSTCFAGTVTISDDNGDGVEDLPDPATEITLDTNQREIKKLTIKGIKGSSGDCFVNSSIASVFMGSVSLLRPQYSNSAVPFGLAADYVKKLSVTDSEGKASLSNLDSPADSQQNQDAEVRLV